MKKQKDWREDYVICEHVYKDKNIEQRHIKFRVCCEDCYQKGFLFNEIETKVIGKFAIGKFK